MSSDIDNFHEHLENCDHCADNPFNLCETGSHLIKEAADEAAAITAVKVNADKENPQ